MSSYICVGVSVLDRIWRVTGLPLAAGKQVTGDFLETGGGLAATAAVAIARLGERCAYWGRVGDDLAGRAVLDEFEREGIDASAVRRVPGARTTQSAILVAPGGERSIVAYFDPALDPDPAFLPLERVATARGVLADTRWIPGSLRALGEARRVGVPSVLDIEPGAREDNAPLCALAGHKVFSEPGLAAYAGRDDPEPALEEAYREHGGVAAVTLGARGVLLRTEGGLVHVPAPRVDAVDTTGAGDAFHGAYLVGIAETGDPIAAARFACAVAALKCTRLGGRAGLPSRADVQAFVATGKAMA